MAKEKILVVHHDLDFLSRVYLVLIHRRFKVEACNNPEELAARLKRFRPAIVILNLNEYNTISSKLKIPAIVLFENGNADAELSYGDIPLKKPVHMDDLLKAVEKLV